jgi:hypothetical protein
MNPNIFRTKFAAACLATAIAGTGITLSHAAHGAPATAQVSSERVEQTAPAPAPAPVDADADRYAEREATAKDQKAFQGGNMIVIGISTTAAIVILVVLLLIL